MVSVNLHLSAEVYEDGNTQGLTKGDVLSVIVSAGYTLQVPVVEQRHTIALQRTHINLMPPQGPRQRRSPVRTCGCRGERAGNNALRTQHGQSVSLKD